MQSPPRQNATPLVALEVLGLTLGMLVGFGLAFYAGYNHMPYVLAPVFALVMACSTSLHLLVRHMKGRLIHPGYNPHNLMGAFWFGCVLLVASVIGCLVFAITGFGHIKGLEYEGYGLYASLGPCVLAVFCSAMLAYDSKYYWRMWQREYGNNLATGQVRMYP